MTTYEIPQITPPPSPQPNAVFLVSGGDLRLSAKQTGWPLKQKWKDKLFQSFLPKE